MTNGPAAASSGDAPETQVGFDLMSAADQAGAIAAAVLAQLAPRLDLVETNVQAQISGLQAEIRTVAAAQGQTSGTVRRIEANQAVLERRVAAMETTGTSRAGIGYQSAAGTASAGGGSGGCNATTVRANPLWGAYASSWRRREAAPLLVYGRLEGAYVE